jgi:alpha-N-arabinofuranosidase
MQKYVINTKKQKAHIDRNIYGHFSEHLGRCIYEGLYVGEDSNIPNIDGMRTDVVEALKAMGLPLLRWPGGCFADEYHWKDGIGPKENRKKMINTHWGGVVEDNSFGTHEFMRLCELLECEPYINGNVGSGTVQEMSEWVEYMTFDGLSPMAKLREENGQKDAWKVKYFGVGNENWGCGGNMRPEYYADLYRRYQTYTRNYGDNKLFKIAGGPNVDDYNWTKVLMEIAGPYMDGLSLHFYTFVNSWEDKGSATQMTEKDYYRVLKNTWRMEELVTKHSHIMDKYDPQKRVALIVDEWGTWYEVEPGTNPGFLYQQNSMRDALVAGINLNIFNKHADRVRMANIAQLVNVLQSVILTEGEKMIKTPTYHVFDMYQEHQDNQLVESYIATPDLDIDGVKVPAMTESASVNASGQLVLTLCNLDLHEERLIDADTLGFNPKKVSGHIIRGAMDDYNTFEEPEVVKKEAFDQVKLKESGFTMTLPTCSVVRLILE